MSRAILLAALSLVLAACTQPRAHAALRVTDGGVKVRPSLATSIAGIGVSVSQ
ncbi:MAG TPA: hypothetical protein PLI43_09840 [Albidovulum sp.]|uniref:hypothetical protein n=1 Tax=Albidovulum sp. TaxID=1872424 RepID=UPI002C5D11F2|nr:hypothetical protein [Albidovulum sp.]